MKKKTFVGPHNIDILSAIFGGLLGDSYAEKRVGKTRTSTRITMNQGNCNQEYLFAAHKFLSSCGYCSIEKPKQKTVILKNNKTYFFRQIHTYSFASFNWLRDAFYPNGIKCIPTTELLEQYLTPLALAVWISDDGSATKTGGVRIATNCFSEQDILRVCKFLKYKYGILATTPKAGKYGILATTPKAGPSQKGKQQYNLYIRKQSVPILITILSHLMAPSMLRKLHVKA